MEEKSKNVLKSWKLWVGATILTIIIIFLVMILSKPKFEVVNFSMESETTEYTYTANSISYTGTGLITTQEKNGVYLVALKRILKSGGEEDSEKEYYTTVMVSNGKGEFSTFDMGDEGKIIKPEYEFEILGYIKF